jgi:hypothetical protein
MDVEMQVAGQHTRGQEHFRQPFGITHSAFVQSLLTSDATQGKRIP